jgi:mRNA interferase MazF
MRVLIVIYEQFDVIKVPFPFTDKDASKKRPALVLSKPSYYKDNDHYILAMITSAKHSSWPQDIEIMDLEMAGLPSASKIRFKIFSLDSRVIISKLGRLGDENARKVATVIGGYF